MKLFTSVAKRAALLLATLAAVPGLQAGAQADSKPRPTVAITNLFPDKILAKGKGVEVKQSQVDEMYITFKANRAAIGQEVPDELRPGIERDILEKLLATQLFTNLATPDDKEKAKELTQRFVEQQIKQAASEESFERQLRALGMAPEQFRAQIFEQAVVEAVIDREIRNKKTVTEPAAREFYEKNPNYFQEPELARVSHILISTQDPKTGRPLAPEAMAQKRRLVESLLDRAKKGDDFATLVKEFSDDAASKEKGGEYTIGRAKEDRTRAMVPEFEAAAFSLAVNQISDLVTTRYGYHIIKALEKIPAKRMDFVRVEGRIKEILLQEAVKADLPAHVEKLKKAAGVELLGSANAAQLR